MYSGVGKSGSPWASEISSGPGRTAGRSDRRWRSWTMRDGVKLVVMCLQSVARRPGSPGVIWLLTAHSRVPNWMLWRQIAHSLIRARQAEDVLAQVVQDHLLRDRGDAVQAHLPPQALHVVLLRVAEAAQRLERGVARIEARLRGEVLGRIGLGPAGLAAVVPPCRLEGQQLGRVQPRRRGGERMGDRLVLADRPAEHVPLAGVPGGDPQRRPADSDRLDGGHDAFGVEAVEEVGEPPADLSHHVLV